ncbi:MAG: hypothetical protein M3Z54_12550, partial [Gemmatimonadota bacterium]|nr:hypothetical protein [Gemmatimonadota bacterium]
SRYGDAGKHHLSGAPGGRAHMAMAGTRESRERLDHRCGRWTARFYTLPRLAGGVYADAVSVSAVDRSGNESMPVFVALTPAALR